MPCSLKYRSAVSESIKTAKLYYYGIDEPWSALDPIAEYEINNLMMNIAKDKTVVMIAHRLSTVVNADCILLIDGGKVLEMGSHKQLLEQNGKYAQMFNLQAEQYQAAKA